MSKLVHGIERAYPWLLIAPVLLPVVIWGGVLYPYLVPKTLFFYALSLLVVGAFAILATHGRAFYYARLTLWESWIPGALLVLAYLTSLIGIDFYRSFWSLFVRGDGLLMLTGAVASFYLILLYADRAFFDRMLRAVGIVGSSVALYGIGEWLIGGGRIGSLLGNAAFFAGYLGVALFATLASADRLSRGWRRAAYIGAGLQLIAIVLTATRGTMLALLVTGFAYLAYRVFFGQGKSRTFAAYALAALVIFGGIFFALRSSLTGISFEPISRIASISTGEQNVASRLFIWKHMVTEIQKSPLLGVGAEHIDVLFNRFYDPTKISEQWFDRSHNTFLDYAAQYGLGGLLLYLALIAAFFSTALRLSRSGETWLAGMVGLLAVTYAVQNFFVFDTVSSFWLMLALLSGFLAVSSASLARESLSFPVWARGASWLVAVMLILFILPVSVRPAIAAYDLAQAYKYQLTDVAKEVRYLSHGFALMTYGNLEYGYQAYDMYANNQAGFLMGQARLDAYQASLAILTANFDRYPYDARTALYLAHVLSLAPAETSVDQNLLAAALARAIKESPKRSQPWYVLANLSIANANAYPPKSAERIAGYAAAQDILNRYIVLVPTLSAPYFVLAQLLYASGNLDAAASEAAKGKQYYKEDLETARRAAVYYETVVDLPNAAFFLEEIIRLDPSNTAAADDLAKIRAYEQSRN